MRRSAWMPFRASAILYVELIRSTPLLVQILTPMTGQFISLIKDSSLLSSIGVQELTQSAQEINSYTYSTLESYLPLAVGYLVLTFPLSLLAHWLEKRMRYGS